MSDALQMMLGSGLMTIATMVVKHLLDTSARKQANEKLDTITELANSTLSHTTEKKEEAEKKLEQTKEIAIATKDTEIAELKKQLALLTRPGDTKQGG